MGSNNKPIALKLTLISVAAFVTSVTALRALAVLWLHAVRHLWRI
jgi:hypothetical protein